MDCRTGEIKLWNDIEEAERHFYTPLDDGDVPKVRKMSMERRKNWMRNKPCVCGSGKKFKKCCWYLKTV